MTGYLASPDLDSWDMDDTSSVRVVKAAEQKPGKPRPRTYVEVLEAELDTARAEVAELRRLGWRLLRRTRTLTWCLWQLGRPPREDRFFRRGKLVADEPPMLIGSGRLDPFTRRLNGPNGSTQLSGSEVAILVAVARKPGMTVSWDEIQYGMHFPSSEGLRRSHVYRLRRRMESVGLGGLVVTVKDVGLMLVGPMTP